MPSVFSAMRSRGLASTFRLLLAAAFLAAPTSACQLPKRHGTSSVTVVHNRNVRFGIPAPATSSPEDRQSYLIERPEYVLSYNDSTKCPNWVSWNLLQSDIGEVPRGSFEPDPLLPTGFQRVSSSTYDNSGFDRGHMCNSKDRTDTSEHNDATFYMTNVVPQAPNNNQKGWEQFEAYCRKLCQQGNDLYIVCGPFGIGGEGKNGQKTSIGKKDLMVTVPAVVWKVVMVLPAGSTEPDKNTRTIALWMPNDQSITTAWKPFIVSIKDVEMKTGYKFFPNINDDVAKAIKTRVDPGTP